jgi:hypothetical protein
MGKKVLSRNLSAHRAKALVVNNIESGRYRNRNELNEHIAALGLTQTRDGVDYVGFVADDGKRVRIYLEPPLLRDGRVARANTARVRKGSLKIRHVWEGPSKTLGGFSVYVIAAVDQYGQVAGYVGSTENLVRRLTHHVEREQFGKASYDLKQWALANDSNLYASQIATAPSRALACLLEGLITKELHDKSWYLPGMTRWMAFKRRTEIVHSAFGTRSMAWNAPSAMQVKQWQTLAINQSAVSETTPFRAVGPFRRGDVALVGAEEEAANHGKSWNDSARKKVARSYLAGVDVNAIAKDFGRTKGAILYQLMDMAKTNDDVKTRLDSGIGFED